MAETRGGKRGPHSNKPSDLTIPFDDLSIRDKLRVIRDTVATDTVGEQERQRRRAVTVRSVLELPSALRGKIDIFRTVPTTGRGDNIDALVTRPEFPLTEVFVTFPNERTGKTNIISARKDLLLRYTGEDETQRANLAMMLDQSARPSQETPADRLARVIFEIKFMDELISGQKAYAEKQSPTRIQQAGQAARVTNLMEEYNIQKDALILEYLKTVRNLAKRFPGLSSALVEGHGSDKNHRELRMGYLTETGKLRYLYQQDTQPELQVSRDVATTEINIGQLLQARSSVPDASDYAKVADRICKILKIS
jgi:hypothetical protein